MKTTIRTGRAVDTHEGLHWPRDVEEWKRYIGRAVPWIATIALAAAAGGAIQKAKSEKEKDEMSYAELTRRKAGLAGDKTSETWEDTKHETKRNWFGLKKNVKSAAEEAEDRWDDTKRAAKGKANEAAGFTKDKVEDVKAGASHARGWASEKAHDAADATRHAAKSTLDATKSAAYKAEHAVGAAGSSVVAGANAVEEKAGHVLKQAGKTLEEDGRKGKQYWRGEEVKEEAKKKGICSIM